MIVDRNLKNIEYGWIDKFKKYIKFYVKLIIQKYIPIECTCC